LSALVLGKYSSLNTINKILRLRTVIICGTTQEDTGRGEALISKGNT
jgi:hypothetical protein